MIDGLLRARRLHDRRRAQRGAGAVPLRLGRAGLRAGEDLRAGLLRARGHQGADALRASSRWCSTSSSAPRSSSACAQPACPASRASPSPPASAAWVNVLLMIALAVRARRLSRRRPPATCAADAHRLASARSGRRAVVCRRQPRARWRRMLGSKESGDRRAASWRAASFYFAVAVPGAAPSPSREVRARVPARDADPPAGEAACRRAWTADRKRAHEHEIEPLAMAGLT